MSYVNDSIFDDVDDASLAVEKALPEIILRHRSAGILTWAILHQIEDEVLSEVAAAGEYDQLTLNMIRSIPAFGYPKDDRPASFEGHEAVPITLSLIVDAWNRVH